MQRLFLSLRVALRAGLRRANGVRRRWPLIHHPIALSTALALLTGCGSAPGYPPTAPSSLLGRQLPTLERTTLEGRQLKARAFAGKSVVVKFFAQYCDPCTRALPITERLHQRYSDVTFVGVSVDPARSSARQLAAAYGLTFPVIHDGDDRLKERFDVLALPVTFVTDRRGIVRWVGGPQHSESHLYQAIEAARQ